MKRNLPTIKMASLVLVAFFFMSNRGGSPGGRTGSTTDDGTCGTNGGCHGGAGGLISQDFLSVEDTDLYVPEDTMTIVVSPTQMNRNVWGFEMMAEDASGNSVGEFISNGDANALRGGERATHKFASSSSADGATWNVRWKGPAEGTGDVTFYASSLAANGNGTTGGDRVLVNTLTLKEGARIPGSVSLLDNIDISLYPNPTTNTLNIKGSVNQIDRITVFNSLGVNLLSTSFQSRLDVSDWLPGLYYVKLQFGNNSITKTVLKQ